MLKQEQLLSSVPSGLRDPLLKEFNSILQNYLENRWSPSELSGGMFCEIVYSILHGHAEGTYAPKPFKPSNFVVACRALEQNANEPRSFQILIPRLLPGLYEVRNNRGVGHVGGDVDPNYMDATFVSCSAKWIIAELVRVFHNVSVWEAQAAVDTLTEVVIPLVWNEGDLKRVLDPKLPIKQQILILIGSATSTTKYVDLVRWIEPKNKAYLLSALRELHSTRHIEFREEENSIQMLPPGAKLLEDLVTKRLRLLNKIS